MTLPAFGILPAGLVVNACKEHGGHDPEKAFFLKLVHYNNLHVPDLLETQIADRGSDLYGAIPDKFAICHPGGTASFIYRLLSAYFIRDSRYFSDTELLEPCLKAAGFLEKVQHEDGTFDLLTTNFNSPPDTAFIMEPVCVMLNVLKNIKDPRLVNPRLQELGIILEQITLRAGECLVTGGIHTPNHRWVGS